MSEIKIEDVFGDNTELDRETVHQLKRAFEKLLSFLDRLAYAVEEVESLKLSEIAEFGWHYRVVSTNKFISSYCQSSYPCILSVAPKLQTYIENKWGS